MVVFLILGLSPVWGEDAAPTVVIRQFQLPIPDGTGTLPQSLKEALTNSLRQKGFAVVDGSADHPARFEGRGVLVRENGNLILQVAVEDLPNRSVVASDMISVYEGLTAFGPINTSMAAVADRARAYWQVIQKRPLPVPPIQDALVFQSKDEGAEIFWMGHQSIGKVTDGQVTAPYYPFPSNAILTLTIEKEGRRTKTLEVTLNPAQTEYPLPTLDKLRIEEWHFFDQGGRLLGFGAEYRRYFVPEWAFWSVEAYPFLQWRPDVATSKAVEHLDVAGSVATWLYFSADSWFRFGLQSSLGLNQTLTLNTDTPGYYFDATVIPFGVLLEWNVLGILIDNRIQVPYSLGLSTGLLSQRWLLLDGTFPMISLGAVWKW